jgi:CheY-like chemotaxis protein
LKLINEVLDISRIESGSLAISSEPVCAAEVVSEVMCLVQPIAELRHVTLINAIAADDHVHVLADRQRLTQVLLNLISNAIKYNVERGSVRVEIQTPSPEAIRITVTDTGPGIPQDKAPLMFVPFERLGSEHTDTEGTGLGLAVSKRLVDAMSGEIGLIPCDSGACFYVDLPAADNPMSAVQATLANPSHEEWSSDIHSATLLLVEDNPSNVKVMEKVLGRRPELRLLHAKTGEQALSIALQHIPDLVLLDLNLPDHDGGEVLAELKAHSATAGIPVIVVSADATQTQISRLRAAGALDYLTKPFDVERLFFAIDACLTQETKHIA